MITRLLGLASIVLLCAGYARAQAPAPTPAPVSTPAPTVAENPLPVLPGMENAVEFWKQVFTRYRANDVILHDRQEPFKVYKVVSIEEGPSGRNAIKEEIENISQSEPGSDVRAQRGISERFASGLALSRRYIDQMRRIFREEGLPEDIAYLPLVESSFDLNARSTVGALGIWQFMPSTGRNYMRVGPALDERRDPIDSTRAAARFLKQNYNILGNWPLAITAYNHGAQGILRAVNELGTDNLVEIIRRYQAPSFGFASKSFYAEFLAAVEVAKRSDEFFPGLQYHPPLALDELSVGRNVPLAALLKPTGISHSEFFQWNPAISAKARDIPAGYRIKAPSDKLSSLNSAYQKLAGSASAVVAASKSSLEWIMHHVAPGETLYKIARNYRVTVDAIQQANGLKGHSIAPGQQLKIPKKT
jgi:membrane-bound lytic murein transglycosylase D